MKVYKNISELITLQGVHKKDGRNLLPEDLSSIQNAAIVFDEHIKWFGKNEELPEKFINLPFEDLTHKILLPEIIDSHTHLIFAGNRSHEYRARLDGVDYEEIAKMGGGILSSSRATNEIKADDLLELCRKRIKKIHSYGIGTIEIKSGYGLNYQKEKELTLLIDQLKKEFHPNIQIINTFLAAHAIPENTSSDDYISQVVIPLMEELKDVIDIVDIFHEQGYFEESHVSSLFQRAKSLNLNIKSHADEFYDNNGASLASSFNALSCDHLLKISNQGIKDLSNSNTVATLLPGTAFFLGKALAPARSILDTGAKVAMASDYNPGSNHWDNLIQIAKMSAPSLKMNTAEIIASITYNAAASLNLKNQGHLEIGLKARFTKFDYRNLNEFLYNW